MPEYRNIPIDAACYSEVAQPGEQTLCVTVPEMVQCGVSENTILYGVKMHRKNEIHCWSHHNSSLKFNTSARRLLPLCQIVL